MDSGDESRTFLFPQVHRILTKQGSKCGGKKIINGHAVPVAKRNVVSENRAERTNTTGKQEICGGSEKKKDAARCEIKEKAALNNRSIWFDRRRHNPNKGKKVKYNFPSHSK